MNNFFSSRKAKYGSVAAVFIAVFIAAVILLNAFVTVLDRKYGLYADMTSEQVYGISDATRALLADLDTPVEIIFCRDRDKAVKIDSYMLMIVTLAEKYAAEFDNISVKFIDLSRDSAELNRFKATTSTKIATTDVIINNPSANKYRHVKEAAFFTIDSENNSLYGFNGEMRFTSSILAVTNASDNRIVFTTGHDETSSSPLLEVLVNAGYSSGDAIGMVDLSVDEIPENTRLLIISNPKRDFLGADAEKSGNVNEIAKINRYLKDYGNLFVLINDETPALPELQEFLEQDWGITYHSGEQVIESDKYAVSVDGSSVIAQYNLNSDEADTFAYQIMREVANASTTSRTIMESASPLYAASTGSKTVAPLLFTSDSATVKVGEETVAQGSFPLMAISSYMQYVDNVPKYAHVIVSGSTDFANAYMSKASYANADLMYSILKFVGTEKVPISIDCRPFNDTTITGVGNATLKSTTLKLTLILPLLILAAGLYVFIRRKHL